MTAAAFLLLAFAPPAQLAPAHLAPASPGMTPHAIVFHFEPREGAGSPWTLALDGGGRGVYESAAAPETAAQPIQISPGILEKLQRPRGRVAAGHCETRDKHIASTGMKNLRYDDGSKPVDCTFNYSDDASLMDAVSLFQSIAATLQMGERLRHDLRFDRLGLDADLDLLVAENLAGRALELGNIAPLLTSLADDDRVMDRVRRKAARLAQASSPAAAPDNER